MTESVYHHLQTSVHRAHTATYADRAAREAATVTAADVGKLALQSDTGDLYRLAAQTDGVGTWAAVAPLGDTVVTVNATGGADYTSLSAALAAITDAAADKRYTILVSGIVSEAAAIEAKSYVNVQGLAGARLEISMDVGEEIFAPALVFNGVGNTTWQDLVIAVSGESAVQVIEISSVNDTVMLKNLHLSSTGATDLIVNTDSSTPTLKEVQATVGDAGLGNEVTGYAAAAHGDENLASGDYSLALGRFAAVTHYGEVGHAAGAALGLGRRGEVQRREFVLGGVSTGDTPVDLTLEDDSYLTLPNMAAWTFEALVVGYKTTGSNVSGHYLVSGGIRREATAGATAMPAAATVTVLGEDDAAMDVTATADATHGSLKITCTGKSGSNWAWAAAVRVVQVLKATT